MKVSSSSTKSLIFNILNFEDNVSKRTGQPMVIAAYPKKYFKAIDGILKALQADVLTAYWPSTIPGNAVTPGDVVWIAKGELAPEGHTQGGERFSDKEIDLGDSPITKEALRYMYALRNELPRGTVDAVDELETLTT